VTALLQARGLTIRASTAAGQVTLVEDIDLEVGEGEIVGLIGESGSGKTTTVRAMIGLLDRNLPVTGGEISLRGRTICAKGVPYSDGVRGRHIGMVFQGASASLNPLMRIGKQMREVIKRHDRDATKADVAERSRRVLTSMGFTDPDRVLHSFPHQLSGGMRQRVAIALAAVTEPDVIIADECTSALDVTTQAEVVALLRSLTTNSRTGMLFVTHDLMLAREICSRIAVMYAGQIVETGEARQITSAPRHPYTRALLEAIPTWGGGEIRGIDGSAPRVTADWRGCRFAPRCPVARESCTTDQVAWTGFDDRSGARCLLLESGEELAAVPG
jgi:oligopeptide/dipeptide ABC transporter ATP-binding protein